MSTTTIFITGYYDSVAAADDLHKYLAGLWQNNGRHIDRFFRYDQVPEILNFIQSLPPTQKLGIVGFSWGFDAAVEVAAKSDPRWVDALVEIDGVPRFGNSSKFPGFSLSGNVRAARSWHRDPSDCKKYISAPIWTAKCAFINQRYMLIPGKSEEEQHGQLCLHPAEPIAFLKSVLG